MPRPEVHQFLPSLGFRDAVGNHTLGTQRALTEAGIRGGIWAESFHPEHRRRARPFIDYPRLRSARRGRNVLLYQASTGSHGMVDFLIGRRERKLLYYHNVTPPKFYEPYDPAAAGILERGLTEIRLLCGHVDGAMANSEFSANDLRDFGVEHVEVFPPYDKALEAEPDRGHSEWLRRTKKGIDVLFVGRLVPNKGHINLLRSFAALRAGADAPPRLFVAGTWGHVTYMEALRRVRDRLGRDGIVFSGSISDSVLAAHYREADVYLCLSEHEGFCVPLVESMRWQVPVVAYDAGAIAETLGGAGVLLRTLDPLVVAEVVARVARDEELRASIIERQNRRLAELYAIPRDQILLRSVERLFAA